MRAIITGGRDYVFTERDVQALDQAVIDFGIDEIYEGGALGADKAARAWAKARGIRCETFRANWDKYGLAAGPIRNLQMLKASDKATTVVLAFPGNIGTADMKRKARSLGFRVVEMENYKSPLTS